MTSRGVSEPAQDGRGGPAAGVPACSPRQAGVTPWLVALAGGLCYLNTLGNDFTYDDFAIVRDNPRVHTLSDFRGIWLRDWWYLQLEPETVVSPLRDRLYRPLTLLSFALNHAAHGPHPAGFHAVNILLHAFACALVWTLVQRLFRDPSLAALTAILFAVHPVHCEAVASIVGRAEVLAAVFLMLGLLAVVPARGAPGPARMLLGCLAFLAALLAKETALCYPALAAIAWLWAHGGAGAQRRRGWSAARPWILRFALLLVPLGVYLPLRFAALEHRFLRDASLGPVFNPLMGANLAGRIVGPFTIFGHYTRMLLLPDKLAADYGLGVVPRFGEVNGHTLLGAAAAAALVAALAGFRSPSIERRRAAALAGLALASYALISNSAMLIGVSVAERLLYWPSAPLLALVSAFVLAVWRRHARGAGALARVKGVLRVCGVLIVAALAGRTLTRNLDWRDDLSLFRAGVETFPNAVQLNNAYARKLTVLASGLQDPRDAHGTLALAERHLLTSLRINPQNADTLQQLGVVRTLRGDREGALAYLEAARAINPRVREAHRIIAELRGDDPARGIEALEANVERNPDHAALRVALGRALLAAGRHHAARQHLERAVERDPDDLESLRLLGQALLLDDEDAAAAEVFAEVLRRDPDDWETHANMSAAVVARDPRAALHHAERALALQPDDLRNRVNLGAALAACGLRAEALREFRRIERELPPFDPRRAVLRGRIEELERGAR